MKRTIKLIGTIVFTALLAFATSCGDGSAEETEGGVFTETYDVILPAGFPATADFSYSTSGSPLSNYITGTPTVIIRDGKVNISLDMPKVMGALDYGTPGVIVNPSDAKYFTFNEGMFFTSDYQYALYCKKDNNNYAELIYVDKDVTENGTFVDFTPGDVTIANVSLKKGCNYYITSTGTYTTVTASTTLPPGFRWVVE